MAVTVMSVSIMAMYDMCRSVMAVNMLRGVSMAVREGSHCCNHSGKTKHLEFKKKQYKKNYERAIEQIAKWQQYISKLLIIPLIF